MSRWGPLAEKYESVRPRRMLALDGGGIRGVITLEVLVEIERQLAELTGQGDQFRMGDWFDYIGGTSTGAIIGTGLARGLRATELRDFYIAVGPRMFHKSSFLSRLFRAFYQAGPLAEELKKEFGVQTDLSPEYLRCLLLIVTRNVTTDSPWPLSSNPWAKYNDPDRPDCNLRVPLWKLVRASTAAPIYFPPEVVQLDRDRPDRKTVFVDGGVTPYNNPAFLLYRMATLPEYRLGWPKGERNLMLVSVGTGTAPTTDGKIRGKNAVSTLADLPGALMYGALVDQDTSCRMVGRCLHGAEINREIGDLIPRGEQLEPIPINADLGRDFLYARYNADLSREGLDALELPDVDPRSVQLLDSVEFIEDLQQVGRAVAREIRMSDFGPFLET